MQYVFEGLNFVHCLRR